jgi:hypothetical protein
MLKTPTKEASLQEQLKAAELERTNNYLAINELNTRINESLRNGKVSFEGVILWYLRNKFSFDFEHEAAQLEQAISDGYTQISQLKQQQMLLNIKIDGLHCREQCEKASVTFIGQGLKEVTEGTIAHFKCKGCGQEFESDLSQIKGLDGINRLQQAASAIDEFEFQQKCVNPGLTILEVACKNCYSNHLVKINRKF